MYIFAQSQFKFPKIAIGKHQKQSKLDKLLHKYGFQSYQIKVMEEMVLSPAVGESSIPRFSLELYMIMFPLVVPTQHSTYWCVCTKMYPFYKALIW